MNSSELVRLLVTLAEPGMAGPQPSFAERLGDWLGWTHAITLSARVAAPAGPAAAPAAPAAERAGAQCRRARGQLVADLAESAAPEIGDDSATYAPWRQHYVARQRAMEAGVAALRAQVRSTLAGVNARLRELAALDAVLDEALLARERSLLGRVPGLLQRRFDHLRVREPAPGWPARFGREMEAVLRAELEVRLQPVDGLIEALREEAGTPE